jgi:hypothetical protein
MDSIIISCGYQQRYLVDCMYHHSNMWYVACGNVAIVALSVGDGRESIKILIHTPKT